MRVKLNKDKFTAIDGAFLVLKEDPSSSAALQIISQSLQDCFDCTFDIKVITDTLPNSELFVMSVYPELPVIDKIISAIMSNKETDAIKKLWETNKKWTIEIDGKLLKDEIIQCNEKELTAMLLHEVGHIVCSSSLPNRISLILRYEIMKTNVRNKMMIKDKIFRTIMALPVLDACISDGKRDKTSIKEEIKADAFAKKMGYQNELLSVLTKLSSNIKYPKNDSINDKMIKISDFSLQTLDDFQQRREKLAKKGLLSLRESCQSIYINNIIDEFIETVFEDSQDSLSLFDGKKIQYMQERADNDIEEGYFTEFFIFGKELKRIDPAEIDYIDIKIQSIKNNNDKMMIVSYIHSKLDLVEYYISIMENPKLSRKYNIPHSINQLYELKKRLLILRKTALEYRIPERNKGILVAWPSGYEG